MRRRRPLRPRLAQEYDADNLGEAEGGQAADQGQRPDGQQAGDGPGRGEPGLAAERTQIDQELAGEAVQGRQTRRSRRRRR